MADPASDFIRDYQTLAQQSWNTWTKQLQQPPQPSLNPFAPPPAAPVAGGEVLERTLAGLKGYFDWMQGAAAGGAAPMSDWRQQLQQMFGNASQPSFSQAFAGIDTAGAEGFAKQWQSWMQAIQNQSTPGMPGAFESMPAFGQHREQQMQQQAMTEAVMESMQAAARYQALIQKASAQGMQRLQEKLAQHAEPGRQIDSMKGLYDLWVDASEEGYSEIALSDEFRNVYGDMVNTQMRVRQMQLQQTEKLCQQMGMPTRSEVSSLGERLQALRREFRSSQSPAPEEREDELVAVKRELTALKRKLANASATTSAATKSAPAKRTSTKKTAAAKKVVSKKVATKKVATKKAATKKAATKKAVAKTTSAKQPPARKTAKKIVPSKSKSAAASTSRTRPRKRK
ncbi:MAG: poly(R)-hydroxyalkanoic acid synthase subunit PhaE [Rhodanobacter sp.]